MTVTTLTIPIQETLLESLRGLGEPERVAEAALRRYAVDNCWQHIERAERKIVAYEGQYGLDYTTFNQRVCTDQPFLDAVNREHPMWEADAIEWVYRIEEVQTWRERLQKVLREL